MCLKEDTLVLPLNQTDVVWELLEDGGAEQNWRQNSDESKVVF
jgi:hypothetical protein